MYEVGKDSVQYRGPIIWNFLNRIVRFSKDTNEFSCEAPMIAKKSDDFIFFRILPPI